MRSLRHFFPNWSRAPLKKKTIGGHGGIDPSTEPAWRRLYVAALFEADERRIAERIAEAKNALLIRARELFLTPEDHAREQSAIEETLQALHALEQCAVHFCTPRK